MFQVEYKPGKLNAAADALSRRDEHEPGPAMGAHALSRPEFLLCDAFPSEAASLPEVDSKRQEIQDGVAATGWMDSDGFVLY